MAVQVLAGANAQSNADRFNQAVVAYQHQLQEVQAAGKQLGDPNDWRGAAAQKFNSDFDAFLKQAHSLNQRLETMGRNAKSSIDNIDHSDQSGAGTFSG